MLARSRRSALSSPPMKGAAGVAAWRKASANWLLGQTTPSSVSKANPSAASLSCPLWCSSVTRPCKRVIASGCTPASSRRATERSARSAVAAWNSPWRTSIQARTAPSPWLSSKGRLTWRRNSATWVRGKAAYKVPLQRRQSPLASSSDWRKRPCKLKRSPQSAGGVASRRKSCRRKPLRTTRSTLSSANAGALRCSSTQRRRPLRTTNSGCEKNQSTAPLAGPLPLGGISRPATKKRPALSRRISSAAPSRCNCSKRNSKASKERAETAALTLGKRRASRCWRSFTTTLLSSMAGIQPPERTWIASMVTGTPSA